MNTEKKAVVFGYRRGTIRLLLIVCTGLWLVAALVYAGGLIDRSWLTPSERKAAIEALKDVDAVRNFGMMDDSVYDAQVQRAEAAVAKTDKAAFTFRDHIVSALLNSDLQSAKAKRKLERARQHATGEEARKLGLLVPAVTVNFDLENQLRRILGLSK